MPSLANRLPSLIASSLFTSIVSVAFLVSCASRPAFSEPPADVLVAIAPRLTSTSQALVVLGAGTSRFVQVWLLERDPAMVAGTACTGFQPGDPQTLDGGWRITVGPIPGVIGERGFASPGEKREGDRRSPTGTFTLTEAFGTDPIAPTNLPYKVVSDYDAWCEDPASPNYNQWIVLSESDLLTDRLKRADDLYRHAAVIDYNRWPVIPGAGSAIFLHRADPDGAGTLGCVGLDAVDLLQVLKRLNPTLQPIITMGTPDRLSAR